MADNTAVAAKALREYADAIRGDWGSIDGRSEKNSLNRLADVIEDRDTEVSIDTLRDVLGVCPHGQGHWTMYCDEDCEKN